jgi:RimJ/RimL family protein N-acetyltransferase
LRTVATTPGRLDSSDIRCLTEWRNRYVTSFLTEFVAQDERTARWLCEIVGPSDSKILFMLNTPDGTPFGYMGLAFIDWQNGYGEADAIVRGLPTHPGTMSQSLRALLEWARNSLELRDLGVRVRSDNPALAFYQRLGFQEFQRVPLRRTERPGEIVWTEDPSLPPGGPALVHMRWNP